MKGTEEQLGQTAFEGREGSWIHRTTGRNGLIYYYNNCSSFNILVNFLFNSSSDEEQGKDR